MWDDVEHQRPGAPGSARRPGSDGEHRLQRRMGTTDRANRFYDEQVLDRLNPRMMEFVGRQEMFFLATADRNGECDNTFRAGPPGFLRVLDERTLAYPEYRGNGVLASIGNIEENPHLGILMVDFLRDRIGLHVNGRARTIPDEEMRRAFPGLPTDPVPGRRPQLWVEVAVEEAYIHCAKHIPHLQKVSQQERASWGTDDHKRKGGDYFGAAADAAGRVRQENPAREHAPRGAPQPPPAEHPAAAPAPTRAPAPAPTPTPAQAQAQAPASGPAHTPAPAHASAQAPGATSAQAPAPVSAAVAPSPSTPVADSPVPPAPRAPAGPAAAAWQQEAERALAAARSAAARGGGQQPFSGWFG
ncbi:pyridoxamine 5'-phosphate oxidase family protein [Streptomyces sp. NPDC048845]|uniref:pyridoxamine 5'-phosphate oxidase family protein n=1 Tax=Streptomyces sp. NPDC048845 TaxID=3155390 RepID=UPI00343DA8DE